MNEDLLLKIAYDVLAILVPALMALAVELIRRKLGVEKMQQVQKELQTKQDLALLAVKFVEQTYKDLHGQDKYDKAAEWLSGRTKEYGLRITPDEVKGLIESILRMIKDKFGEEWANAVGDEADNEEAG